MKVTGKVVVTVKMHLLSGQGNHVGHCEISVSVTLKRRDCDERREIGNEEE